MNNNELKACIAAIFDVTVEEIDEVDALLRPAEEQAEQEKKEALEVLQRTFSEVERAKHGA